MLPPHLSRFGRALLPPHVVPCWAPTCFFLLPEEGLSEAFPLPLGLRQALSFLLNDSGLTSLPSVTVSSAPMCLYIDPK